MERITLVLWGGVLKIQGIAVKVSSVQQPVLPSTLHYAVPPRCIFHNALSCLK